MTTTSTSNGIQEPRRDNYMLSRGGIANARLTFQHLLLNQIQGWKVASDISAHLEEQTRSGQQLRIADLATGNGIWAIEMAELYPAAEVIGIDISDEQFPLKLAQPSNLKLETGNIFEDMPDQHRNTFDVVHLRLTVAFIYDQDMDALLRNVLSMLKPGGWIQWSEIVEPMMWVIEPDGTRRRTQESPWNTALNCTGVGSAFPWVTALPQSYKQNGLLKVQAIVPELKQSQFMAMQQLLDWVLLETFETFHKVGLPNVAEVEKQAWDERKRDDAIGRMFAYGWQVAIGQKPTNP